MPCGGVYFGGPLYPDVWTGECISCGQGNADHFVDEWDAFIHAECVIGWLQRTEEGQVVLNHAHNIIIILDIKERQRLLEQAQKQKRRLTSRRGIR